MEYFAEGVRKGAVSARLRAVRLPTVVVCVTNVVLAALSPNSASIVVAQQPPTVTENSIGMRLVRIAEGEFEMGSEERKDEMPAHRVRITKPFLLGEAEVTQRQWRQVMGSEPWKGEKYVKEGPDVAVAWVSWDEAVEFCARLTKLETASGDLRADLRYRLPTEAEWEYACRAGSNSRYSFGDDEALLEKYAWFDGNAWNKGLRNPLEVRGKQPNPWGLFDTHGNVWEWCGDWYDEGSYAATAVADPQGPQSGSFRVLRGGSWFNSPQSCRSAFRYFGSPEFRSFFGFRVVREIE